MIESIVGCTAGRTRLAFVVSLPFVIRDVKVSGMLEKTVLSLWWDGDLYIRLGGMGGDGGDNVSSLKLVCGVGSVIGPGREVDSKPSKRSVT